MIIAIESASSDISIALATPEGEVIAADGWTTDRSRGEPLLPRLAALAAGAGRRLDEASGVAVGTGPGSFTGLRVGMSAAKGLAFAAGCPIVGLPSLAAWLAGEPNAQAALARAGATESYLLMRGVTSPAVVDHGQLPPFLREVVVVAADDLASALELPAARAPRRAAAALARTAALRLAAGPAGDDLEVVEPLYLRPPRGLAAVQP